MLILILFKHFKCWKNVLPCFTLGTCILLLFCKGLVFNIYSLVSYKSYLKQRRERVAEVPNNNVAHSSTQTHPQRSVSKREMNENRAAKNMLYMALTLSSFSIISRILLFIFSFYFYFFASFTNNLIVSLVNYSICTLIPTLAIFVFYFFNKIFRQELNKTFCSKNVISNEST